MENENGVSEIAGAILLVALVILAMMIVAVALLSQPPPREIPQVNAVAGNNTSYIFIRHNGGDPLTPLETIVRIDGNPNPVPNDQILLRYENGTQANWTTQDWTVGTTLVIPDSRTPQSVSLIYNGGSSQALLLTATFTETPASVAPTLPPGSYHTITSIAGSGGHISPSGQVQVPDGGFQNFIVTPDPCYRISGVIVDGSPAGAVSSYSFNNVQADHTISAAFASNTLSIVATAGANGSILPNGTVPATCHGSQTFSITPSPGYYVQNVLVDGSAVGPVATYTFGDIVANHTISASFSTSPPYCVPVIANFNAVPTSGDIPLSVTFTDTSTGHPNSWQWDFGDGTVNSTVQNPIHTYAAGGSYTVTLTAFNTTCGNSGSVTFTNLINATSPAPACGTISGYKWNDLNGNGNWDSGEPGLSGWTINVSEKQGNHWTSLATTVTNSSGYYIFTGLTYHPANDYLVQETLQTGWQETFPASGSWEVHLEPPGPGSVGVPPKCYATDVNFGNKWAPDFSGSPRNGPAPLTVDFTDLSTGSSSWLWNFGDGGTSTNKNPTHTYPNPGTYTVTLTVSNSWQTVAIQKVGYIVINSCMSGYGNPILFNKNWNDNSVHGFLKDGTYVQVRNIYGTSNDHSYIRINGETIDLAYGDTVRLAIHGDQTTGDADIYTSQITRFNFYADLYINDLNTPYRTGSVDKIWIKVYDSYMSTLSFHMPSITSSTRFEANGNVLIDWYPLNGDIVDIVNIGVPPDGQARIDLKSTSVYIDCSGNYAACPV